MVQGVIVQNGYIVDQNPATGEIIDRILCTTPDDLNDIVRRANDAQKEWSVLSLDERIELLKAGCEKLGEVVEELAVKTTEEMGKPLAEARDESNFSVDKAEFLELVRKANEDEVLGEDGGAQSMVVRDPLGVVAVLSPWNFPSGEIMFLALPALAAGNSVIVKPSEVSPIVGKMTVEALASVLPPGVLQLVQGDGSVGQLLVESDGIHMVAMTGSTAVGRSIMSACASKLKRLVLELGGKDPMVVFADADIDTAAKDAVQHSLENTGQVCCSIERIYVDDAIRGDFERKVVEIASKWKVGNGMDPENKVGPLVSQMQRDRVAQQVEVAVENGAKVLFKGSIPELSSEGTSFYPVTVLSGINQDMEIQKVETFGPVVSITGFNGTEEEAVKLANDTEYGLASCVYTMDTNKAQRVARQIQSGQVGVNCYSLTKADIACPW